MEKLKSCLRIRMGSASHIVADQERNIKVTLTLEEQGTCHRICCIIVERLIKNRMDT